MFSVLCFWHICSNWPIIPNSCFFELSWEHQGLDVQLQLCQECGQQVQDAWWGKGDNKTWNWSFLEILVTGSCAGLIPTGKTQITWPSLGRRMLRWQTRTCPILSSYSGQHTKRRPSDMPLGGKVPKREPRSKLGKPSKKHRKQCFFYSLIWERHLLCHFDQILTIFVSLMD